MAWKDQKISREAALTEIARRYRQWVDVFEKAHAS
jgi:myo-inositol catabolism protein IolC